MRYRLLGAAIFVLLVTLGIVTFVTAKQSGLSEEILGVQGVAVVERPVSPWRSGRQIIQIADFHLITRGDFRTYLRGQDLDLSDAEMEDEFQAVKAAVRQVQANQLQLIRWLAKEHGVRVVHIEGLTDEGREGYANMVRLARQGKIDPGLIGAAGQALIAGDIEVVAPAEGEAAYPTGSASDAREEAIVSRLAAKGPLSVVVLGVEHDLSKHIAELGDCEYLRVYVEGLGD